MPDPALVTLSVEGRPLRAPVGSSVLAALQAAELSSTRLSLSGEPRWALCGIGSCFECRVLIGGVPERSCLTPVREGMQVERIAGAGQ